MQMQFQNRIQILHLVGDAKQNVFRADDLEHKGLLNHRVLTDGASCVKST
jgi:hypothetical protein